MNTAMNRPNSDIAARPRSLMILMSCPAVSWLSRYDTPIRNTAKNTRLYRTLSRTDSLNTLMAMVQMTLIYDALAGLSSTKREPGCSPTFLMKKSSSVSRIGFSETRCAPVAIRSRNSCSGAGSSGSSSEYRS